MISYTQQKNVLDIEEKSCIMNITITDNTTKIILPQNSRQDSVRYVQFIRADWQYIENFDEFNTIIPTNPIKNYSLNSLLLPVHFRKTDNSSTFPENWDYKCINIYSDVAKSYNENGEITNLAMRVFRDNRIQPLSIFSFSQKSDKPDKYFIPSNAQFIVITVKIQLENFGTIFAGMGPPLNIPADTWKQSLYEQDLFDPKWGMTLVWSNNDQKVNVNRPLYLTIRLIYN